MVHGALQVSSAHNKRSTGGRDNNGSHLDRGRGKAASRTERGCAQTLDLHSRQKPGGFLLSGAARGPAYRHK